MCRTVTLARSEEVTEVLHCLRGSLREPALASALALFVSGNGRNGQRGDTRGFASDACAGNGKDWEVLETPPAPYSAILWLERTILRTVRATEDQEN